MVIHSIDELVSGRRGMGKVGGFEELIGDLPLEDMPRRKCVTVSLKELIQQEKQRAIEEKKRKIENFNNTKIMLNNMQDLQSIIQMKKKKKVKKEAHQAEPEAEIITGPIDTPMFLQAASENKMAVIDLYLAQGEDPNACNELNVTALHRACLKGHKDIVEKLLAAGAALEPQDMLERTPVHWACRGGHLDILKLLLNKDAKVNAKDTLWSTPLHVAVRTGHCDCAEHLIACGAEINARDKDGDTAMHDAVRLGRYKAVKMLIMYGASLTIKNDEGKTPMEQVLQWQTSVKQVMQTCKEQNASSRQS
ncbi:ankyrin repeat domain-containing protein 1-like [Protopterus annectens]|uniref:ankyrin repeat domain-containing protein 1-like n=1 Tax=Protopterus annectens TaxID=7888 RepID=UPI001CFC0685|nr:ankyrin repeat domain-containing protein 1-like [Protopterus annectens]